MASQTIASYWLPRYLVAFRAANSQIQIRLTIGNTAQVARAVETGEAELGFAEGAVANEHFVSAVVAQDQMIVVVGPEHDWTRHARLSPDDLLQGEWVMREPGSGTRSVFEDDLLRVGIEPRELRVVLELPSNEAVRAAVEAGLGATAISATVAAASIEAGLLYQAPFRLPTREFHVLRHRERYQSRAAKELLALMAPRSARS
jgi:DNA-binding transcriptional LysR family regulator